MGKLFESGGVGNGGWILDGFKKRGSAFKKRLRGTVDTLCVRQNPWPLLRSTSTGCFETSQNKRTKPIFPYSPPTDEFLTYATKQTFALTKQNSPVSTREKWLSRRRKTKKILRREVSNCEIFEKFTNIRLKKEKISYIL